MSPFFSSRRGVLLILLLSLICAMVVSRWATVEHAAGNNIVVNTLADVANNSDGQCSLREAITAANNNVASGAVAGECAAGAIDPSSDTITISVTGTINLTGVLPALTSDMSLVGPGSSQLTVRRDTGGDYRIFFDNNRNVSISGMTVTNGKTADGTTGLFGGGTESGGGIEQAGGSMNLIDVVITGNRTGDGGLSTGGSGFEGGSSGGGGGLSSGGNLTMTNCVVSNNFTGIGGKGAGSGGSGAGGGMTIGGVGSTVTLTNVTVTGNRTGDIAVPIGAGLSSGNSGGGGGVAFGGGTLTATNLNISNNKVGDLVRGDVSGGGGFFMVSGTVTLTKAIINNNVGGSVTGLFAGAGAGGGVDNINGTLTIIDSDVSGNQAGASTDSQGDGGWGGGIAGGASLTVINTTVSNNSAGAPNGRGGGIVGANVRLVNCTITGNTAFNNEGHGVRLFTGSAFARNTIIAGNGPSGPEIVGTFTSQGHNLIGRSDGSNGFTNGSNGDIVGTLGAPINPQLGPLANNGGNSPTHALLSNSPALDAGDNCVTQAAHCSDANIPQIINDQRGGGFSRLVDGPDVDTTATVDIGAYETQPVLANLADTTGNEDTQLRVAFDAGDTSTISSVTATSSNPILVPNDSPHLSAAINGSTGVVTINPATDQSGTTNILVTVNRTGGPESKTFLLTVGAVNDAPTFTKSTNQTVNEDAGPQTVVNWATNISAGAADESSQTLAFQVTGNTNAGLFSAAPAISSSGTLTYTTAANATGTATITISLKDNGGTANGGVDTSASQTFTITVVGVNDAPSFIKGTDRTVNEDSGSQNIFSWATSISAGPPDEGVQTVAFQVTNNTNPSLFAAGPTVSSSGQLSFTPATNANGSATITIVLKDSGGTANGGLDTSAPQTFTITVTSVNDAPSFTKGANQTPSEDSGPLTFANWATAISPGPADESGQTVTFQIVSNSNTALFAVAPAISATGTLTYTPAADANGAATITINLKDNGGTANGGLDTSSSQSFTITVNAVNDAPSFTKGANQTVNEDAAAQAVTGWATAISPGPANESAQTVTFTVTNDNNALFSVQPAISASGTLTYTPASNANGTANLTVTLKDNGGTTNGGLDTSAAQNFTITITSVNDAPSFAKGPDQIVDNNAGAQTVNNWATNIAPGPANESTQTVTFVVTGNSNPGLFLNAPAISGTGTLTYQPLTDAGGTATITVALQDNGGTANGGNDTSAPQSFNITVNPIGGSISFASATLNPNEGSGFVLVTVNRTGDISRPLGVDYATSGDNGLPCSTANGVATPKCDFIAALGRLAFAAGEDTKTFPILINQDSFVEGPETFTVSLSNQTGGSALAAPSLVEVTIDDDITEPPGNAIDDSEVFVRQHYHDFLNREADGSGLAFWLGQITACGANSACIETKRINVSAAFFLSVEFQETGYLAEKSYKAAYGDAVGVSSSPSSHQLAVPVIRFDEFLADTQRLQQNVVVLQQGWQQLLEGNKQAYIQDFVQTSRFATAFPTTLSPAQFVDKMFANAGVTPTSPERTMAINEFGSATTIGNVTARARALRDVVESSTFSTQEFNRAFVLMEYFGYLRRNPNDAPETTLDYAGYEFWLNKLNQFNGDYIKAEMVKAFISSSEYRQRFGQ